MKEILKDWAIEIVILMSLLQKSLRRIKKMTLNTKCNPFYSGKKCLVSGQSGNLLAKMIAYVPRRHTAPTDFPI